MLQKEFFWVESFNPRPYFDSVVVNLSGAQAFEANTIFKPGRYRIEIAPGLDWAALNNASTQYNTVVLSFDELFTDPFIIRAYCGSSATSNVGGGTNPYSGQFKVNAVYYDSIDSNTHGTDVNHIFGAGGGSGYLRYTSPGGGVISYIKTGGGANCLGNGNVTTMSQVGSTVNYNSTGAGSCLHVLPVGGIFGTNYIRAYHAAPCGIGVGGGSALGGGATPLPGNLGTHWFTRGGNSPYGTGATTMGADGTGVGAGKLRNASGAYFNGSMWIDVPANIMACSTAPRSYIKVTYLGTIN